MLRRIPLMRKEAERLKAEAQRLITKHSHPPAGPLFDRLDSEGP